MAGIYIHIPFCKQACNYCNFYFTTSPKLKNDFVDALIKEIELQKYFFDNEIVESIYFGGGTPSHIDAADLMKIADAIFKHFNCNISEFTIEANPDDLTSKKITELLHLKSVGLNRFSIGVQSFVEDDLRFMSRAHSVEEATAAIKRTQDAGFDLITLDLIYGTPTLSNEQWLSNLAKTKEIGVPHFSSYALTVEENTSLYQKIKKQKLPAINEEKAGEQFDLLMQFAAQNHYEHYEISNFALQGKRAIHNSNYWKGKHYLGLGPSAHSFKHQERSWNLPDLKNYILSLSQGKLNQEKETLNHIQRANEFIMTSLRTIEGLPLNHELTKTFKPQVLKNLEKVKLDYYKLLNETITLTNSGKHFADAVALALWLED